MPNNFDPETGKPVVDVAKPEDVAPPKRSPEELLASRLPEDRFKYIVPVFAGLIGAVMLIGTGYFAQALAYLVCGIFVISGLLMVFGLRAPEKVRGADREQRLNYAIYTGAWFIILGIASLAKADIIVELIPVFFGSVLCLLGVVKLRLLPALRRLWFALAASAYLSVVVGILVIIIPGGTMQTVKVIGIAYIVEAVLDAGIFIAADVTRRIDAKNAADPKKRNMLAVWIIRAVIIVLLVGLTVLAYINAGRIPEIF